jgi:hypothetical protein
MYFRVHAIRSAAADAVATSSNRFGSIHRRGADGLERVIGHLHCKELGVYADAETVNRI